MSFPAAGILSDTSLRRIDHVAQLFRQLTVAELGLVGGNLHRDGKEVPIVATDVRLDEGLDLLGASHFGHLMTEGDCDQSIVPLAAADATGYRPRVRSCRACAMRAHQGAGVALDVRPLHAKGSGTSPDLRNRACDSRHAMATCMATSF